MTKRFPFPIPTGWFAVHWSADLEVGQVKPLRYFAKDLVLFRTSDGVAHIVAVRESYAVTDVSAHE